MRNLPILLGCVLLSITAFGQLRNATFRVSVNYPYIASVITDPPSSPPSNPATGYIAFQSNFSRVRESYDTKPGVDLGLNVDALSWGKFFLRTGLSLQYQQYTRRVEIASDYIPDLTVSGILDFSNIDRSQYGHIYGTNIGASDTTARLIDTITGLPLTPYTEPERDKRIGATTVLYLQVPVTVGRRFLKDKLTLSVGFTPSVLVRATRYEERYSFISQPRYSIHNNKSGDGFANLLVNGIFDASYSITKRIGLHLSYQRSFTPIYDEGNRPGGKAVFNTLSFGAGYRVGK